MKINAVRLLFMMVLVIAMLALISCSNDEPLSFSKSGDNEEDKKTAQVIEAEEGWKWRQLGPDKAKINQIQFAADGSIYLLSKTQLYLLQEDEFLKMGPPDEVAIFYVMGNSEETLVFAANDQGELYLKKGASPWSKIDSPVIKGQPVDSMAGDANRGIVFVGQSSKNGGGLWKSQDEGKSWEKLTDITVRTVVVHPSKKDYLYIVDKAAYFSQDGGKKWERIKTPANYGLLIHPQEDQTLYLAYSKGVVIAQSNGIVKDNISFKLLGAMTCLEINFAREKEWAVSMWDYPSGSGGIYFSFNKGLTWTKTDEKLDNVRILDMRFDHKGDKLYLGTAGRGLWVLNLQKIR